MGYSLVLVHDVGVILLIILFVFLTLLIKIARTHPNQMVRKQAIRSLGESGDPRAIDFFREVLTK